MEAVLILKKKKKNGCSSWHLRMRKVEDKKKKWQKLTVIV